MKANPGGNLDPDCVYGRENLINILWDEVPWMLESIARNNGLTTAAEVLDTLRSLRVEHNRFRVVLTGSIGLHHVLGKLSAAGIPTSATNGGFHFRFPLIQRWWKLERGL